VIDAVERQISAFSVLNKSNAKEGMTCKPG
jgi:hypothetical protein